MEEIIEINLEKKEKPKEGFFKRIFKKEKKEIREIKEKPKRESWKVALIVLASIFLLILLIQFVWYNISFSKKDYSSQITNNVDTPVNVENNHTIFIFNNITNIINIPEDFIIKIQNST